LSIEKSETRKCIGFIELKKVILLFLEDENSFKMIMKEPLPVTYFTQFTTKFNGFENLYYGNINTIDLSILNPGLIDRIQELEKRKL
jgi:hypothetical protein